MVWKKSNKRCQFLLSACIEFIRVAKNLYKLRNERASEREKVMSRESCINYVPRAFKKCERVEKFLVFPVLQANCNLNMENYGGVHSWEIRVRTLKLCL